MVLIVSAALIVLTLDDQKVTHLNALSTHIRRNEALHVVVLIAHCDLLPFFVDIGARRIDCSTLAQVKLHLKYLLLASLNSWVGFGVEDLSVIH